MLYNFLNSSLKILLNIKFYKHGRLTEEFIKYKSIIKFFNYIYY